MIGFNFFLFITIFQIVSGCTNIIISKEVTEDNSNIIAYNADSATMYGSLYHYPESNNSIGTMRDVYDWDSGNYLGQIEEALHTYNVVGNVNEFGLIIGETTFGGIESLQSQSAAKIDYGSLIWITLQRAKNAREAIHTIDRLMQTYGYASEGESFSIADPKEAWIMEIIGKGNYALGAVWVARKVPDGFISAHANQARITTFPLDDPSTCLYSQDVISFARKIGLYPDSMSDIDFSFSDIYDPVTFSGARFCDARVWSVFSFYMGETWSKQYLDYAMGYNLTNRMPLFVKPSFKTNVAQVMDIMRNHYENSSLDMLGYQFSDVGAYTGSSFRTHPLTWSSNVTPEGKNSNDAISYLNERPIATYQTGWNFVGQSRQNKPTHLAGLLWFGVDDSSTTVRFPIYGSTRRIPSSFAGKGPQDGITPPMLQFSIDSAFYVFNLVANWAYSRWDLIYPDVLKAIKDRELSYLNNIDNIDKIAAELFYKEGLDASIEYISEYACVEGDKLTKDWFAFFGQLFVKYRDGYIITPNSESKSCGCDTNNQYYPQSWYDRIVRDTQGHYLYLEESDKYKLSKITKGKQTKDKRLLNALR